MKNYNLTHIEMSINNACNYRCIMCTRADKIHNNSSEQLEENLFLKIVREIKQKSIVTLVGGEPLLYFQDRQYLYDELFANINIIPRFITNGSLLDKQIQLLEYMPKNNWRMEFSVEGVGQNYESLRKGGSWENVLNNIKVAIQKKPQDKLGIVGINYIATNETLQDLKHFVTLMDQIGVDYVHVHHLTYSPSAANIYNTNFSTLAISDADNYIDSAYNIVQELKQKQAKINLIFDPIHGNKISYSPKKNNIFNINEKDGYNEIKNKIHDTFRLRFFPTKPFCYAPFYQAFINQKGEVLPCCTGGNLIMGSCFKDNIYDIYSNDNFKQLREDVSDSKPKYCCCSKAYSTMDFKEYKNLHETKKSLTTFGMSVYYDQKIQEFKTQLASNIDMAIENLESIKTQSFNSHSIKIWNELAGVYLYRKKDYEKTKYYVNKILSLHGDSAEALIKYANIFNEQGHYDQAIDILNNLENSKKDNYSLVYFWLGYAYEKKNMKDLAVKNYQLFLEKFSDKTVWGYQHALQVICDYGGINDSR